MATHRECAVLGHDVSKELVDAALNVRIAFAGGRHGVELERRGLVRGTHAGVAVVGHGGSLLPHGRRFRIAHWYRAKLFGSLRRAQRARATRAARKSSLSGQRGRGRAAAIAGPVYEAATNHDPGRQASVMSTLQTQ
jgi:hypothetical protein